MKKDLILEAARLAATAHNGQKRKWAHADESYVLHPMRVAGLVALHPLATPEMVAAAWLHDVLEDTKFTEQDLLDKFGGGVVYFVKALTNPSKGLKLARVERKKMDREHLRTGPWGARLIKLADRIDNLRDMLGAPEDFAAMYREESKLLLEALKGTDEGLEAELAAIIGKLKVCDHDC